MTDTVHKFLCVYGHFYQPPREDPFTGLIPNEFGAAPFENFNEKITDECYRPNAEAGNLALISFDLGPTLAAWLEQRHPDVYQAFIAADREHRARYGVGNALAQAYNHAILPLATSRDKRVQIRWGLDDFARRFGHRAEGMWLAETAVDQETLSILAEEGVRYTVLAPWQAAEPVTPGEPYLVALPGGRSITVFFYHGALSAAVSFEDDVTSNADVFAATHLRQQVNEARAERGEDQLVVIATDGELYGHHKPLRDFLPEASSASQRARAGLRGDDARALLEDTPATTHSKPADAERLELRAWRGALGYRLRLHRGRFVVEAYPARGFQPSGGAA